MPENNTSSSLRLGIDVGSTTVKAVIWDKDSKHILYSRYERHHAEQIKTAAVLLEDIAKKYPDYKFRAAVCGSGGKAASDRMGTHFIQEVVANAAAVSLLYPRASTAVELGGQDAKVIFFRYDENAGRMVASDMRMNGSCAGGTGAFIDEVAAVLKTPSEEFNALASKGSHVYPISGRCGVFAKTDIQGVLNQGGQREDIALSAFHAIAKQTIGGLAQGIELKPPIIFEGGPLTFNPRLVEVFRERLHLEDDEVIYPENAELIVACGAAIAVDDIFPQKEDCPDLTTAAELLEKLQSSTAESPEERAPSQPFFESVDEQKAWQERHKQAEIIPPDVKPGDVLNIYIGIDAGSTTSKLVFVNENEEVIDRYYANNRGDPIRVIKHGLMELYFKYRAMHVELNVLGVGTTGYGELMLAKAIGADYHTVETVAHTAAAKKYVPDASFVLDIGGQDMKAIWVSNDIITNMTLNEACSSGCGSFLENFADSLGIKTEDIADAAFRSQDPAQLGSRCTVFMNSTIITEQRNGKDANDIMAGLCRSIIANVFTKVIRISNLKSLGDHIVVQGGTFKNDAVLRSLEQYIDREVTRAPYPGEMGCIGAAILAKRSLEEKGRSEGEKSSFIGFEELSALTWTQENGMICPYCGNHCSRTLITFSNDTVFVTGNRCERGEITGDPRRDPAVREKLKVPRKKDTVPNMFKIREELLFKQYPYEQLCGDRNITIGIPRVLSFWETMPFWSTFWRALGFKVDISNPSTREMYESGISGVTSDTICFPAKLVHGHLRNLYYKEVDRIFMPSISTVESENTEKTSESMCAVVKGYPIVIRNSDDPFKKWGIPFDAPLFHWYKPTDRNRQLCDWMKETFGISADLTAKAVSMADAAQQSFSDSLKEEGQKIINEVTEKDSFAVILASRPYQNDYLVNHDLPQLFIQNGIPVLTADSLPEINTTELVKSRIDIVNNYHARMLSSAILAAADENLEYVQLVSFGCGHDAYLSDEIIRLMNEISGKNPLVLKLDEGGAANSLNIRVRSFLETVQMRRRSGPLKAGELSDPYPVKFTREDRKKKVVLVPNTSHAFSRIMAKMFESQGIRAVSLDIGREEAIRLGKQYVHNDICFPAQIVIGEALAALKSGKYDDCEVAIGMGKYIGDCRLTHYGALLRKALDDAGYKDVPIVTNDDEDRHDLHPGFKLDLKGSALIAFVLPMIDVYEELLRKIRPYELIAGSANEAFEKAMDALCDGMAKGFSSARKGFAKGIELLRQVRYDRSKLRPKVLIVGEYLLNFHPGANHDIEDYLEKNGFEIIEARMTDVIRKTYFYKNSQIKEYHLDTTVKNKVWYGLTDNIFNIAHHVTDSIAKRHPLYERAARIQDIAKVADPIINHTFDAGEGILIPGEILHNAEKGCKAFIILQPFGCLPNHIVGRGIAKKLKELYPDVTILPLDYDPDVSFANIENRLQMLIMSQT